MQPQKTEKSARHRWMPDSISANNQASRMQR